MQRTCFICRGQGAQDTSLSYHELARRTGGEEFFVFIDPVRAEHEPPLRELFRRVITMTRLGSPVRYLRSVVEAARGLPGAPANGSHLSDSLVVVVLRKGGALLLLRNKRTEPVCFEAASGTETGLETFAARREIGISRPGRQGDLFEKSAEDQFILEAITMTSGEHTLLLAPSREFIRRHRDVLLDSVLFPAFEVPASGEIRLETSSACPAIHWRSDEPRGRIKQKHKRGKGMFKSSAPIIAGAAALILAVLLIFKPFGGERSAKERREALFSADGTPQVTAHEITGRAMREAETVPAAAPVKEEKGTAADLRGGANVTLTAGWSIKLDGAVTSSPAICAGRVIFGSRDGHVYAYSTAGIRLWKYRAADGVGASPCCAGEMVIGADYKGNVFCIDAATGKPVWNYQAGARIVSSPRVEDKQVIACTMDGRVIALDLEGGQRVWSQTIGESIWATPATGREYIVAASIDGSLVKLARDGSVIWRVAPGGRLHSSPLVIEGRDLVVIGTGDGHIAAHSLRDGSRLWKTVAGSEIRSTPASDGNRIFVGTEEGTLLATDMSGTEIWRRKTKGAIRSRPLILREVVIITSYDAMLSAFSAQDGSPLGAYRADSQLYSSPAYHDGRIFFGSNAGLLHAPLVALTEG